jgi:hypothetical protein
MIMDDTAEGLLSAARIVRRRLCAELLATEAAAQRDDRGTIEGEDAKSVARLRAKIEYVSSIVERHELEHDATTGWPYQTARTTKTANSSSLPI